MKRFARQVKQLQDRLNGFSERLALLAAQNELPVEVAEEIDTLLSEMDKTFTRARRVVRELDTRITRADQFMLNDVLQHFPFGIVVAEADTWKMIGVSQRAREVIGKRDGLLLPPESVAELEECKRAVLESGTGMRREFTFMQGDERITYDLAIEPLRDASGDLQGLIVAAIDITEKKRLEEERRANIVRKEVQHHLTEQREVERMQIAHQLHDGPIQDLSALVFDLQHMIDSSKPGASQTGSLPSEAIHDQLLNLQLELQNQIRNLRTFTFELRPPMLSRFSLARNLRAYAESYSARRPDLDMHLELMDDGDLIPDRVRTALFRICQEGLVNVDRHAQARQVWLRLKIRDAQVNLEVQDDGQGFVVPDDWLALARRGHLGLVGVQERVEAIGGRLAINSTPGQGTRLHVDVPLNPTTPDGGM